jgi:hypothetical protein
VVGTGASAIQFVPEIARTAAHVDVYQRSASYVLPKFDHPYGHAQQVLFERFPVVRKAARLVPTRAKNQPAFGYYLQDPPAPDRPRPRPGRAHIRGRQDLRHHPLRRQGPLPPLRAPPDPARIGASFLGTGEIRSQAAAPPREGAAMSVFTVDLKNQPGELARLCEAMAGRGINLVLSATACGDGGTAAFIADDEASAENALRDADIQYAVRPALTIRMENQPGTGAATFRKLADAGVNADLLLPVRVSDELFFAVICVDDQDRARHALGAQVVPDRSAR